MSELLTKLKNFCLDILFPPVCLVCRRRLDQKKNSPLLPLACPACSLAGFRRSLSSLRSEPCPLAPRAALQGNSFSFLCPSCSQKIQINTGLDRKTGLAAAVSYSDEIPRQLIAVLKYQKIKTAAVPLGEILSRYIENCLPAEASAQAGKLEIKNYFIVPVPLHWHRERERGFNQVNLIAEQLSRKTGWPVLKNVLKRIRNTPSQVELKEKKKREMNVRGCFAVENPEFLAGKNIIILDDVSTSGATMREAIKTVRKSGAKKIIGLVVAKV